MLAVAKCCLMAILRSEFQPGFSAGLFFFYKIPITTCDTQVSHHAIFRASAFIACLTSTQLPMGDLQFLHDMTVSLVRLSGTSSRPPHFPHLKLLSALVLLVKDPSAAFTTHCW